MEEKSDGHALSLDQMEPSDIDLIEKIAYYMKNENKTEWKNDCHRNRFCWS